MGEISDGIVEIENCGVLKAFGLVDYGLHHFGVAVAAAHRRDSPERVHISPPFLVEQVLPLSIHQV